MGIKRKDYENYYQALEYFLVNPVSLEPPRWYDSQQKGHLFSQHWLCDTWLCRPDNHEARLNVRWYVSKHAQYKSTKFACELTISMQAKGVRSYVHETYKLSEDYKDDLKRLDLIDMELKAIKFAKRAMKKQLAKRSESEKALLRSEEIQAKREKARKHFARQNIGGIQDKSLILAKLYTPVKHKIGSGVHDFVEISLECTNWKGRVHVALHTTGLSSKKASAKIQPNKQSDEQSRELAIRILKKLI